MRAVRLFLSLLFGAAGSALLWRALEQAGGWERLSAELWKGSLPQQAGLAALVPGVALFLAGLVVALTCRARPPQPDTESPIDVKPLADWVRDYERHQAELIFSRGYSVQSERCLELVKYGEDPSYSKAS